jgi:hypothetical protein
MTAAGRAAGAGTYDPLAEIRRQYPGWRLWWSDRHRPWATRIGRLPVKRPAGFALTIGADTARELAAALAEQEAKTGPDLPGLRGGDGGTLSPLARPWFQGPLPRERGRAWLQPPAPARCGPG